MAEKGDFMFDKDSSIADEVAFGFLPAQKNDRVFGLMDLTMIQLGIGISCFGLLTGAYAGMLLSAKEAVGVIMFGNALPVLLIAPIIVLFTRYGVDTFIGFRSALGYLGSNIFYFIFMILTIGYTSIALYMAGQSVAEIAGLLNLPEVLSARSSGASIFSILLFFVAFLVTFRGPLVIRKFNVIGVPAIVLVMIGLIALLVVGHGLTNILSLNPPEPYVNDPRRSFMTALEINIGLGFSWLPYFGQYARLARSERASFKAGFFSYGVLVNIAAILGGVTAIVVASVDPVDWMLAIGGTTVAFIGLTLLTLGNLTAAIFLMYSQAISFKTVFPKKSWLFALSMTIPTILLLTSSTFYYAFDSFITVIAYIMSVFGGIVVFDFYFVKRQNLSLLDLYDITGRYNYYKGINPSALVALIIGTIVYWGLYNPITDTPSTLFQYITAGIPAYFVSGISFYIASVFIFKNREATNLDKENKVT